MRTLLTLCILVAFVIAGCDATSSLNEEAAPGHDARTAPGELAAAKKTASNSSTVVVTSNDLAADISEVIAEPTSWFFYNDETDEIDNSLGTFVAGPGTAPAGTGSAEITVSSSLRRNLATYQFSGTPLADITAMAFSTYNPSAGNGGGSNRSGYLHFNVDFDGSDSWQGRLVFVPTQNGTVVQDAWQEWDTIDDGNALWWWSGFAGNGSAWPDGNTSAYRTWNDLLAAFPDARVRVTDSWLGMRVGSPYPSGYTENLDAFVFGTADGTTTFDFEPLVGPPANKNACKKGGWQQFNNPSFKNQGQCIQYVNTGK